MIVEQLLSLATPIGQLIPLPGNPRKGDVDAVAKSYEKFGQRKPIVANRDGTVIAGNHQLLAAKKLGWTEIAVVFVDDDDLTAKAFALADNRTADLGTYDDSLLAELLADVSADLELLTATGFTQSDVDEIIANLTVNDDLLNQLDVGDGASTDSMHHNVDLFFNASAELGRICNSAGWRPGIISSAVTSSYLERIKVLSMKIDFVDNEFKEYNHESHVSAVSILKPKYATVRDIMTKKQCNDLGIEYYSLDQIIEMANDVGKHAENVMLIPKYDCISDIPDEFMLGFSVPTSYGGTALPIEKFVGRRVHLLGGNWKRQRNALAVLGDSCVSIDNNHMMNIARFGCFYSPDGRTLRIADVMPGYYGNLAPMLLSMSAIVGDLSRIGCTVNGRRFESKEDVSILDDEMLINSRMDRGDATDEDDDE